jgi:hypothetical protein
MIGAKRATVTFATKSASELPTAKMVNPMMASERPKMRPNVYLATLLIAFLWVEERMITHIEDLNDLISDSHNPDHSDNEANQA